MSRPNRHPHRIKVFPPQFNPQQDSFLYFLSFSRATEMVLSRRAIWLDGQSIQKVDPKQEEGSSFTPGGYLDAWGKRPSAGMMVWQLKTQRERRAQ